MKLFVGLLTIGYAIAVDERVQRSQKRVGDPRKARFTTSLDLSEDTFDALNTQIGMERNASYLYQYIATTFKSDAFFKVSKQFETWSKEEAEHAEMMSDYLITRGRMPIFLPIALPSDRENYNLAQLRSANYAKKVTIAFDIVAEAETRVYESIVSIANTCNDLALEDFLIQFMTEGIESVHNVRNLMKIYKRLQHSSAEHHFEDHYLNQSHDE